MNNFTMKLPSMYADHHVMEVRRLLFALPGVEDVYASSGFQLVEVAFDPSQLTTEQIEAVLTNAGYVQPMVMAAETGASAKEFEDEKPFFRHTVAYAQVGATVGFAQVVPNGGRPLWPCPGIGVLGKQETEETTHG